MSPLGGLTRNLLGDEVWILKAIGIVECRDLSSTVARHLVFSVNSIRTSDGSHTSTSFSIFQTWVLGWIFRIGNWESGVSFFWLCVYVERREYVKNWDSFT